MNTFIANAKTVPSAAAAAAALTELAQVVVIITIIIRLCVVHLSKIIRLAPFINLCLRVEAAIWAAEVAEVMAAEVADVIAVSLKYEIFCCSLPKYELRNTSYEIREPRSGDTRATTWRVARGIVAEPHTMTRSAPLVRVRRRG
jgi:hypothetical protein